MRIKIHKAQLKELDENWMFADWYEHIDLNKLESDWVRVLSSHHHGEHGLSIYELAEMMAKLNFNAEKIIQRMETGKRT